jgi:hypothetical protein
MCKIFEHVKAITESAGKLQLDSVETVASCVTVLGHAAISAGATDREILDIVADQLVRIRHERLSLQRTQCNTAK